jgi:hypothetical protein
MVNSRRDYNNVSPEDLRKKGYRLCSDHFEDSQYNNPSERTSLRWNAVPTLFQISDAPKKVITFSLNDY